SCCTQNWGRPPSPSTLVRLTPGHISSASSCSCGVRKSDDRRRHDHASFLRYRAPGDLFASPEGGTDMQLKKIIHVAIVSTAALTALPVLGQQQIKIDFANETVGAEPKSLLPVVGVWRVENERGRNVLAVDGRQWKEGQSSAGIADKARALYG